MCTCGRFYENFEQYVHCTACGSKLPEATLTVPQELHRLCPCGNELLPGHDFCRNCGTPGRTLPAMFLPFMNPFEKRDAKRTEQSPATVV